MTRQTKGFSLIESAIVLGVMGMVIAGVWQVMASARSTASSNTLYQQMLLTTKNVRDYFASRALPTTATENNTTYTNAVLRAAGVFPDDMCPANCVSGSITTVYNIYQGITTFYLWNGGVGVPTANRFTIRTEKLSRRGCIDLGMKLSGRAREVGLVAIRTEGASNTDFSTFPVSATDMNTACAPNASTGALAIILTMSLRNN